MKNFLQHSVWLLVCGIAAFSACSRSASTISQDAVSAATAPEGAAISTPLDLTYDKPAAVGTSVHATAKGLPPGKTVTLNWGTVTGGWVVEDYYHFRGKKYSETTTKLGEFRVDSNGKLDASFPIPEDYGGVHEVLAVMDGKVAARNGVEVTQTFELSPKSGAVGTPIELKVKGLGWRTMESTWVVNWDNTNVGWVSAASTRGSAVARFRATGPVGDHVVKVYTGWQAQSYLNYEQSPVAHLPRPQFTFHTTAGGPAREAYAEPYPAAADSADGSEGRRRDALRSRQRKVPWARAQCCAAKGFPANSSLQLVWQTFVGSRVSGSGFEPQDKVFAQVKVGSDGRFEWPVTIPDDLGGLHGLALRNGDRTGGACLLRHRNQHRQHHAEVGTGGHARNDSPQGCRLDRIRQHLRGDLRQRLYGLCLWI